MKNLSNEYNSQFECLKKEKASINKNLNPDVLQSYKALMIFFICLTLIITNFSLAVSANRILGTPIEEPGEKRDVNEGKSSGGREVKSDKEDLDSDLESITKIGNIEDDESKDSKDVISIIDSVKNTLLNVLGGEQGLSEYWDDNRPILLYEWAFQERFIESPTDPKGREQQNNPIYRLADNAKSVEHGITSSGTTRFNANDYLNRIREAGIEAGGRLALKMQDDGTWGDVYRAFNHWYPKSYNEIRKVLAEFEKAANALRLSPPTNLRAIEVNDTSVRLRWTPPSNTSNVKEYWVILNGQQRIRYNGTTGTIRGLKPDTEYSFYAYSVDSNENLSQRSNRITVRTKKLEPPTNLIATEITHTTANLSWTGSKSETVTGYQVWYREEGAEKFNRAATVRGTNYRLEGLNPSGVYEIYVRAVDENGNRSNRSNAIGISPVIEKPLPPTNLKATQITDTTISLTWFPSRSATVTGYQVWYREQGVGNYSRAGTVDERVFTLKNLDPLTTYEIYVRAIVNSDIRSDRSNLLPVTTDRKEILPPENLRVTATRRGSMNIEWDPSPSSDVKEYWVYRNGVKRDEVSNTSVRVTGISGTEYEIYVKAVNSDGNVSDKSNTVTGKTTGPLPASNLRITDIRSDSVSLIWDKSPSDDVSVYRIYKDGEPIKTITPLNPSFTIGFPQISVKIGNLENSTQYEFYVRAVDRGDNLSTWSNRVNPTTLIIKPPIDPTINNISKTTIDLSWTPSRSSTVKGYQVWYRERAEGNYTRAGNTIDNSFTIEGLTPGTQYQMYIRAIDSSGNRSNRSNILTQSTRGKFVAFGINSYELDWGLLDRFVADAFYLPHNQSTVDKVKEISRRIKGMGYRGEFYINSPGENIIKEMEDASLFYFAGHGLGERGGAFLASYHVKESKNSFNDLVTASTDMETGVRSDTGLTYYSLNEVFTGDRNLDKVKLAYFSSCNSGLIDSQHGDLLKTTVDLGADVAIGFTGLIHSLRSDNFDRRFFGSLQRGNTIGESIEYAESGLMTMDTVRVYPEEALDLRLTLSS